MKRRRWWIALLILPAAAAVLSTITWLHSPANTAIEPPIADFHHDIAPLFQRHCVRCHGPQTQEGGLRLDNLAALLTGSRFHTVVMPGRPGQSLLLEKVRGDTPAMPPDGDPLSFAEIALLTDWIQRGLPAVARSYDAARPRRHSDHWAYQPPTSSQAPQISDNGWCRGPLDRFVLASLESQGRQPAPEADRATLARRLSLDLTGLPPSFAEVAAFVGDNRSDAYERLVDRLLASPHRGEHLAREWLDLARYADSHGYHRDMYRSMWKYRDWVIAAFNANMPFDQFTIVQLAGDLLPQPTLDQLIATGFHRNTMFNQEGGADPEEFRIKAVVDRVNVTATVWLGTTLGCARCHNHPYDPFTQREYFQLFAFFNNTADSGGGKYEQPQPMLEFPTPEKQRELENLRQRMAERRRELANEQRTGFVDDEQLSQLSTACERILTEIPTALVMREQSGHRSSYVHVRGDPMSTGDRVEPDVPEVLPPLASTRRDRLALAQWLVSGRNPLTARVAVNRVYENLLGFAPVETSDDFGVRTARPEHWPLLDHLAATFVDSGWDLQALQRTIVMSATYRQQTYAPVIASGSRIPFAGAVRRRLPAETLRDNALTIGGLLQHRLGGPSVFPPQPEGMWADVEVDYDNDLKWIESTGADRYRRGIYTFWRRSFPYRSFITFDAPSREQSIVRRDVTNTPLQALAGLNDPVFIEAAGGLAHRMLTEFEDDTQNSNSLENLSSFRAANGMTKSTPRDRLTFGWRLCTLRLPTRAELDVIAVFLESERRRYAEHPPRVADLPVQPPRGVSPDEMAAWTMVANVLLNLDATISRW